ncbi:MAG: IS30 family transposase [Acidimicrobiales bacterium]
MPAPSQATSKATSSWAATTAPRSSPCSTGPAATAYSPISPSATTPPRCWPPSPRPSNESTASTPLTLTWDQGREMSAHHDLAKLAGIDVYFAEPHSPWQRPTNENGNGLLRRYVGRGTNLSVYSPDDLRHIEHRLNTMPRRSLHCHTAHDIYTGHVAMTS